MPTNLAANVLTGNLFDVIATPWSAEAMFIATSCFICSDLPEVDGQVPLVFIG